MLEVDSKRSSTPIAGGKKKHQDESARSDDGYCGSPYLYKTGKTHRHTHTHAALSNLGYLSVLYSSHYLKAKAATCPLKSNPFLYITTIAKHHELCQTTSLDFCLNWISEDSRRGSSMKWNISPLKTDHHTTHRPLLFTADIKTRLTTPFAGFIFHVTE